MKDDIFNNLIFLGTSGFGGLMESSTIFDFIIEWGFCTEGLPID